MSDTPRTDQAYLIPCDEYGRASGDAFVPIDFTRQLERELNEAQTQLRAWQQAFGTTQLTHAIARLEAAEKKGAKQ